MDSRLLCLGYGVIWFHAAEPFSAFTDPSLPCGLAGNVGCGEPAGRDARGKPHRSLFRCTEIGDSFENFMCSSVVLGNTLIGDTDEAAVCNRVSQVYNTINRVLTFVDKGGLECLPPVGIETAEEVLQPL